MNKLKRILGVCSIAAGAVLVGSKLISSRKKISADSGKVSEDNSSGVGRHFTDNKSDKELIGCIGFGEAVEIDSETPKNVLVTGAGSYIGESFRKYAEVHYPALHIDTVDMLDPDWRRMNFSDYDVVFHVAGIAHADVGNVTDDVKEKYYAVNTDLAVEVCEKSKSDGAAEFIFMSSMIVYGDSAPYGTNRVLDESTVPSPANFYGDSKLQADVAVRELADDDFSVIVLRPPMIYGRDSKDNYPKLAKLAKMTPIFPKANNRRSMLYIDNLCEFVCQVMLSGRVERNAIVLIPQNSEWTETSRLVEEIAAVSQAVVLNMGAIAAVNGRKVRAWSVLKPAVVIGSKIPGKIGGLVNKVFGNSCYSHSLSVYPGINYQICSLSDSIRKTEEKL